MSQENVEVVQAFFDRWDARDLTPAFELVASTIEWHTAPTSLSAGTTLHGVEAVLRHMDELLDAEDTEASEVTIERIGDIGEEVLASNARPMSDAPVASGPRPEQAVSTPSPRVKSSAFEAS